MTWLALALLGGALAQDAVDEELIVYGDLFARWDQTRWFIATEFVVPRPLGLSADRNWDMRVKAMQIRAVLACDKDQSLGRRRMQVHCNLEDVGLQAVVLDQDIAHADEILDEVDAKLTGASLQLQVRDNGRVTNVDLEGIEADNRRERTIQEVLRTILSRLVSGFDMKLRRWNNLGEGQWVEYKSNLLAMPSTTLTPSSGLIVHQLHRFQGHTVVQTVGEGQIMDDLENTYVVDLQGVSIYDLLEGYMTERVWYVYGERTSSSFMQSGMRTGDYWHSGRLLMLDDDQVIDVGPTRRVAAPFQDADDGTPPWVPIEETWQQGG